MQFRIYDRQTLAYKDGGYVASYEIDDDYIVNNNSKITFVKELNNSVVVGDTIALIQTSGAFHKGTITNYDNADFSITYKADKELFNDNMLNPLAGEYAQDDELKFAARFGIAEVALLLENIFAKADDWAKALPLKIITDGDVTTESGEVKMLWNWSNPSINVVDWLVSLFERYNLSLSWDIDFNIASPITTVIEDGKYVIEDGKIKVINNRNPYYIVTLSAVTNSGGLIKDNVANQKIAYTEREIPEATVCVLIDKENKERIMLTDGDNLLNPQLSSKNKVLTEGEYSSNVEEADPNSDISSYIRIKPQTTYTYSCVGYDDRPRKIKIYDQDKRYITTVQNQQGVVSYNFGETTERNQLTLEFGKNIVIDNIEYIPAYIRICYWDKSTEVQFEEGDTATAYHAYDIPAIYYLINRAGVDMITMNMNDLGRTFPVKTKYVEFDMEGEDTTEEQTAYETLVPSKFNQAIEIRIVSDSKMFDFENVKFGDLFKIINEQGTIDSVYTGRKQKNGDKWVTLYFGLGRQNYTDLVEIRNRKARYQVLYNKSRNGI